MKAVTKMMTPLDYLEFRSDKGEDYYERVTGDTAIAPDGTMVQINSLGEPGNPAHLFFAFTQDSDHTIYLYAIGTRHDNDSEQIQFQWLPRPIVNYPGHYEIGDRWETVMDTPKGIVRLVNKVEGTEMVKTSIGEYECMVINAYNENGGLDSVSYFSIQFGVNVKRISHSDFKPGYELTKYHLG